MKSTTHQKLSLALLLALSVAAQIGCAPVGEAPSAGDDGTAAAVDGSAALNFTLASLDGAQVSNTDFSGQVVVIDFWATWCGPCHYQADILEGIHEEFAGKGVQFLAISLGEPESVVRAFVLDNPYPYPVLVDPEDRLSLELGIYVLPTVMVIDREGNISYSKPGISQEQALRRALYEAGVEHPAIASGQA